MSDPHEPDVGPDVGAPDDHPGDLLSAYVDGELDDTTRRRVVDHLDACAGCRDEVADAQAAKQRLQALPAIDGGHAVGRFVARHRSAVRAATAFVAVAAALVVVMGASASVVRPEVVPAVDPLVAMHAATPEALGLERRDEPGDAFTAPSALLGNRASLSRRAVFADDGRAVIVYATDRRADEPATVTVHQQHGRLDWDALPAGTRVDLGDRTAWRRPGTPAVYVAEVGHLVVTVIADDPAAAITVVDGLPEVRRSSAYDRMHDACQRLTQVFALGD